MRVVAIVLALLSGAGAYAQTAQSPGAATKAPPLWGGCPGEPVAFHACALGKARTFTPPRTPSGRPDLQGYWGSRMAMPFSVEGIPKTHPMLKHPAMPWIAGPGMIVDPADGRIPYQPWAAEIGRNGTNYQQYIDPRATCSTAGVPRLALQDLSLILQPAGDDQVVWLFEDHRVHRVIPMGQGPAVGSAIKLWNGVSRGRWDRNTLVIDVTNLNGYTWFDDSGNFYTDAAHLTERLTMIDPGTIHYEVTFNDPKAYTRPWKMAWALVRETKPGVELPEEACWEGERDVFRLNDLGYRFYFGEPWRGR